jgi:pimeloyl-ACP methyl ester carboxylesterase
MGIRLLILLIGACAFHLSLSNPAQARCRDVIFHLDVESENVQFANSPNPTNGTAIIEFVKDNLNGAVVNSTTIMKRKFPVLGKYCPPQSGGHDRDVLQLLVHGSTYNKSYWSGLGAAAKYNWQLFASKRGYHTLAIDRVGHGQSPVHPDPLSVVHIGLHTAVTRSLVTVLRQTNNPLHKIFKKITFVGHSYGSVTGIAFVGANQDAVDALILTGYSTTPYAPVLSALTADLASARAAFPRFASLPPGYGALASEAVRESAFYSGDYDAAVARRDFAVADTVAAGELLYTKLGHGSALGFRKPVLVITGSEDKSACNVAAAPCEEILNRTRAQFPDAKSYDFYAPPRTGHDITLHETAQVTFGVVHDWLDRVF